MCLGGGDVRQPTKNLLLSLSLGAWKLMAENEGKEEKKKKRRRMNKKSRRMMQSTAGQLGPAHLFSSAL